MRHTILHPVDRVRSQDFVWLTGLAFPRGPAGRRQHIVWAEGFAVAELEEKLKELGGE